MSLKSIDGFPILDAKHPVKIEIKTADCKNADAKEPANCVVARALRHELHAIDTRVHLARVYVRTRPNGPWTRYLTPKSLRTEIVSFDRGGTFEPGEFHLMAPNPAHRATGKRQGGAYFKKAKRVTNAKLRKLAARGQPARRIKHVTANVRGGPLAQS